jgi:hypothetical protein
MGRGMHSAMVIWSRSYGDVRGREPRPRRYTFKHKLKNKKQRQKKQDENVGAEWPKHKPKNKRRGHSVLCPYKTENNCSVLNQVNQSLSESIRLPYPDR